jgi:UDP-glucose 4-epimerase
MRIFVTGGAGFIGIYLCKKLLELNYNVTVFDNFSNSSQKSFLSSINGKVNLIIGNILDTSKLINSMKDHDVVIHLAAKISVSDSIKNPKSTFETNVFGTKNVLIACKHNHIKKIITTSTAAVYKNISYGSILDEASFVEPSSPYGESKLIMEKKILDFCNINNIDLIILRLFNVYGVGQSPEYAGVITQFLFDIQNNTSLTIYGDGLQTRDFVSVHDVVDSIILSITSFSTLEIYNIAYGESINILNLAKLMIEISGKDLKINFKESRMGEIKFSNVSISKAKNKLKFSPCVNIFNGISKLFHS